MAVGTELPGPDGSTLTLVSSSCSFKYWREKNGSRVLNASGCIENGWQKILDRPGLVFGGDLTDSNVANNLGGRVCPPNVFLDFTDMTAIDRGLYFDCGSPSPQSLDVASPFPPNTGSFSSIEASDWLLNWDSSAAGRTMSSSYYEGNIKICADQGMRLPTLYETTVDIDVCTIISGCNS